MPYAECGYWEIGYAEGDLLCLAILGINNAGGIRRRSRRISEVKERDPERERYYAAMLEALLEGKLPISEGIKMAEIVMAYDIDLYVEQGWPTVYLMLLEKQAYADSLKDRLNERSAIWYS